MRSERPIAVIIAPPTAEEGCRELERRVADLHADFVWERINLLNCPPKQKAQMLQGIIDDLKKPDSENVFSE